MYKIVDLNVETLTAAQWAAGNRHPRSAKYSFAVDEQGQLILSKEQETLGMKVILEWEGDEPEVLQGVGTNYTQEEMLEEMLKVEWTGLPIAEIPADETP